MKAHNMPKPKWEKKIRVILKNVEFLHGVPVSAPEKTVNKIISTVTKILNDNNERFVRQLRERQYLINKDGMANEYLQELINDYQELVNDYEDKINDK